MFRPIGIVIRREHLKRTAVKNVGFLKFSCDDDHEVSKRAAFCIVLVRNVVVLTALSPLVAF
jgi:hypothetical protein